MKKIGLMLMVLVVMTGCAQQQRLALTDAMIDPATIPPGDEALICVRVIDTQGAVGAVTATVREYPEFVLDLNDRGEDGDKIAGDGVWSFAFEVPGEAEPGEYNWDFEALDANGDQVKVVTEDGGEQPLTAEAPVELAF